MSLLYDQGTKYNSQVTRFAEKLAENIDGLIKDTMHEKIIVYLQQDVSIGCLNVQFLWQSQHIYWQITGRCYTDTEHHGNSKK